MRNKQGENHWMQIIKKLKRQFKNNIYIIKKPQPNLGVKNRVRKINGNLNNRFIGIKYLKLKQVQQECKDKPNSFEECGTRKNNIMNKSKEVSN